jgi:hypothetical protein
MLHLCPNPARRHPTLPDQRVLRDASLSLTALGLLTKLMNAPADTSTDPQVLATRCSTGRDAIKDALRELSTAGLLLRATVRQPGGQLNTLTLISDDPMMLLEELARLSTRGLVNNTPPPADTTATGKGRQARHARPTEATEALHAELTAPDRQNSRQQTPCQSAAEHNEHYHQRVLRTTHIYMKSTYVP